MSPSENHEVEPSSVERLDRARTAFRAAQGALDDAREELLIADRELAQHHPG